jgi:hypothetical protein
VVFKVASHRFEGRMYGTRMLNQYHKKTYIALANQKSDLEKLVTL